MTKACFTLALLATTVVNALASAAAPPAEAFVVFRHRLEQGPRITPYLAYQTEIAWREDDARRKALESIRDENDLRRLQAELRRKLLEMIGGLPEKRTPLAPRVTGRIQMDGFHIEKVIFESLPGVYVTSLLYVPDDGNGRHPGVLVPCGHSSNGKVRYQALCQRLVKRGYVVICWDPVGQGERSQFWNAAAGKSRYNLICAEHAVMGNLAYLAGASLARWEIWDGSRALDYLLSRPEVDPDRINITGTSGGGFQTAHIAALDERIKVAAPSCYITALPMRMYNRIFKDPDSDPEQDLYGMISNGVDHAGLLLLLYPRPLFVASAVLDFFPIEGTHKTFREVADVYARFHHADRIAMAEGYHEHQYSPENQEAAINFLDRFNRMPAAQGLPPVKELDEKSLQCTRTGQVMLDFNNARSLVEVIKDFYTEHKNRPAITLSQLYYGDGYPGIKDWSVSEYDGAPAEREQIAWQVVGGSTFEGVEVDKYLLRHSRRLEMPLLHIHEPSSTHRRVLLWFGDNGKATAEDWPELVRYVRAGYDVVSFDFRGLGETRMPYKAVSEDDPTLAKVSFDQAYVNPLSGVLADYVYNSLLIGRPYFLQMIEDAEIAARFSTAKLGAKEVAVTAVGDSYLLAHSVASVGRGIHLEPRPNAQVTTWSELVEQKRELWPIQFLLPGGAYIR
ncbi:MAG TPA: acetylxylan esterase [Blastocatellia bacterium]|nr:acetylxylan esterase [Blastocatellia bacterium]